MEKREVLARRLRVRLVALVANPASDTLSEEGLAAKLGIAHEELGEVLTEEVMREAMAKRKGDIMESELAEVDRAMLARAREGHVGAARLLYARAAVQAEGAADDELPSLEELEAELARLKSETK